ncbi:MAG: sigma-54 dependent transcriptional regulator [Ignavibacterium sp.]|jgi:DNA-binding NtrC family response regulator|nr:sigma-54 dependent transcriptional regulator [Ignavibacterium sp.]MDX9711457.1 sigma-54 dependent transcriptional regulator [Ignavibacteriaceae bacterium]MEB2355055.1 sigma-54 dependent transcriptional regulator [Ignavibacteriales bacterium]GIK22547.1 MAG: sigma-54-dependent Fis family transcriptional regulator [Ignavibacteriota bacterium]
MSNRIIIIDDDELVCRTLQRVLLKFEYQVEYCLDGEIAVEKVRDFEPDLILLDIYLTTVNGLDLLQEFQKQFFNIPVIMITGYSDVNIAVKAMKLGAYDFLLKPVDIDQLKLIVEKAFSNINLKAEVDKLTAIVKDDILTKDFFGKSSKIKKIVSSVEKLAKSLDTTILIDGESGTGKEMIARFIHQNSPRSNGPFIQINCSAIPRELAESELFGHEKGAFTGAQQKTKLGKFELANNGTILLDEIGELSQDLQVKLLRVLQEKKFYRVGGEREINIDVRVLAATNKNLEEEVKKGNFREDLFYRLNVGNVTIPPLRERKEDIPILAYAFLNEFSLKFDKKIKRIDHAALEMLQNYYWKGNIRELRNVMERVTLLLEEDELKERHFQFLIPQGQTEIKQSKDEFILKVPSKGIKIEVVLRKLIEDTLKITDGNQVKAAKVLGLSRSKLRYRMEQLGIEVTRKVTS